MSSLQTAATIALTSPYPQPKKDFSIPGNAFALILKVTKCVDPIFGPGRTDFWVSKLDFSEQWILCVVLFIV
jgi:hypothetical protein